MDDIFAYFLQNRLTWVREDSSGRDIGEDVFFVERVEVRIVYEGD